MPLGMRHWAHVVPLVALALLALALVFPATSLVFDVVRGLGLAGAVLAAVHHAEVVAHRVGEPLGALVLALAITIIEVALIVALMLAGGPDAGQLARDTVFAAVMIICNGVVGLCMAVGGIRHREQDFQASGVNTGLAALVALATLSMVLPTFTTSTPGPTYSTAQLIFAAVASLVLWGLYVLAQTVHYREHFLPVEGTAADPHGPLPTGKQAALSVVLLVVALVAVVGLAKTMSPRLELLLHTVGAPRAVLGVLIAMLVLAPETLAALRAARQTNLQTSFNLAYGSALASIGLTIPAVVIVSLAMDLPLILGLGPKDLVLLALTFVVSSITLVSGRTTWMLGAVHLVVFGAFVFLAFAP